VYPHQASALPFFLTADAGERFCLYHQPDPAAAPRGAILYVHPFAEEMNKSRRMAALQSRAYARAGFGVLQIDLYGCGDSSGDFADARWDIWLSDLALGWQWLTQRGAGPFYLWGLRLGALLALDFAARAKPEALILWQPAISGRAHLHQFARAQSAARLFGAVPATSTPEQGTEIAGYMVAPELSAAISQADAATLAPTCPVQWLELNAAWPQAGSLADSYAAAANGQAPQAALQPASALLIERWREAGTMVEAWPLHGTPFWSSADISESPELLTATLAVAPPERG
jgi:exosortase A-associated hydrolase 2